MFQNIYTCPYCVKCLPNEWILDPFSHNPHRFKYGVYGSIHHTHEQNFKGIE